MSSPLDVPLKLEIENDFVHQSIKNIYIIANYEFATIVDIFYIVWLCYNNLKDRYEIGLISKQERLKLGFGDFH